MGFAAKIVTAELTARASLEKQVADLQGNQPDPSRVLDDADVAAMTALAAKNGLDTAGNPVPLSESPTATA